MYDRITAFEMGANDYLAKPCDKEELLARVETLINLGRLNKELTAINRSLEEIVKKKEHLRLKKRIRIPGQSRVRKYGRVPERCYYPVFHMS